MTSDQFIEVYHLLGQGVGLGRGEVCYNEVRSGEGTSRERRGDMVESEVV